MILGINIILNNGRMEFEKLQVIFWSLAESMFTFASPEIRLLVSNNTMDKKHAQG